MGCDIHGWVEVKKEGWSRWWPMFKIDWLVKRNYDMFGCLFGVRNYVGFRPIAAGRGLPKDVSYKALTDREVWGEDGHSDSWITYKEIKEINWEEESEEEFVFIYVGQECKDFEWLEDIKAEWNSDLIATLVKEKKVEKDGKTYVLRRIKRKEALTQDWKILFEIMGVLAKYYGDENVRLVVWFDN